MYKACDLKATGPPHKDIADPLVPGTVLFLNLQTGQVNVVVVPVHGQHQGLQQDKPDLHQKRNVSDATAAVKRFYFSQREYLHETRSRAF